MSAMPTTQQRRAKHAWDTVEMACKVGQLDEFGNQVRRLGPRIVTAGLGPALAFLAAKAKDPPGCVLQKRLADWVLGKGKPELATVDLQQRIRDGNGDELRRWTAETLEWLVWVKRFCDAGEVK